MPARIAAKIGLIWSDFADQTKTKGELAGEMKAEGEFHRVMNSLLRQLDGTRAENRLYEDDTFFNQFGIARSAVDSRCNPLGSAYNFATQCPLLTRRTAMSTESDYLDFELTIQKVADDEFCVRAESESGEAEARFRGPFSDDRRALIEATLTKVALRSFAKVRSSSAPEVKTMKAVGATLFDTAITGEVRTLFHKCQGLADQVDKGIRWRLALDPAVGDLPWEFMYLQDEFLALNPRSPIVRYIKGATRVSPLKSEFPLRVLVIIASPCDVEPLDTQAEKERIDTALRPLTERRLVEVSYIEGPDTWERLITALRPKQIHILHFIGHGAFDEKNGEGVLVMEGADGYAARIDSERLRYLVQGNSRLRLVVLNSCLGTRGDEAQPFSSVAAGLVRSGVPAVIAMQFEISDNAAREIAETFYSSLTLNMPVDAAITEARRKIFLTDRDSLEWATPILYMQVPDGRLFQFDLRAPDVNEARRAKPVFATLVRAGTKERIPLSGDLIRIGRSPENDILLSDPTASRKHVVLKRSGSTYTLENLRGSSGTWVNDEPVTKRELEDGDVIRMGGAAFVYNSDSVKAPAPTAETVVEKITKRETLAEKAAKRYQQGDAALEKGDWAAAIKAFRGALMLVPNYNDAAYKLTVCEGREKADAAYKYAQRFCEEKNYSEALRALDDARRHYPDLVDDVEIQAQAECGQKYNLAVNELQCGNQQRAAELLREVIESRGDFEDATQRLDDLAGGGDGLLGLPPHGFQGMTVPPPMVAQPPPPQAPTELDSRLYECFNPNLPQLAHEFQRHFEATKHQSQVLQEEGGGVLIQGKKSGKVLDWLGMSDAITVAIEPTGNGMRISIGAAHWMDKGKTVAITALVYWPLLISGGVERSQQKNTIESLWRLADHFVLSMRGRRLE